MADSDWKKRLGFDINYSSSQSSEEDDTADLGCPRSERKWQALDAIAAEYDHLSSTPPRTRIRNKEKHRGYNVSEIGHPNHGMESPKQVPRRNTTDNFLKYDNIHTQEGCVDNKRSKRRSLKLLRGSERDLKLDIGKCKSCKVDYPTLQSFNARIPSIPTLVESCNRFMSLSSKPVLCGRDPSTAIAPSLYRKTTSSDSNLPITSAVQLAYKDGSSSSREDSVDSRSIFHSTFSMLIRMGNAEKNASCKRTMSVEEHTWQNELKDLVWLEVCAKRAGRTPTQQDAFLCAKRDEVPALLQEILAFKFKPVEQCNGGACWYQYDNVGTISEERPSSTCLNINCVTCLRNIGEGMRQVMELLDALAEAEALYPSTKAMAHHHPIITHKEFTNKTKAMCLWYNMVRYQRLSLTIIRKLLTNHRWRSKTDTVNTASSTASSGVGSTASSGVCVEKEHKVKFTIEPSNETDTSSSGDADSQCTAIETCCSGSDQAVNDHSEDETDCKLNTNVHIEITRIQSTDPLVLDGHDRAEGFLKVRSISQEVPKSPYESADSSSGSVNSTESGFVSSAYDTHDDQNFFRPEKNLFDIGDLSDLTKLRLFYPNKPSPYRDYLEKVLKSRGIRRALYFLEKIHLHLLKKTRMTLEKLDDVSKSPQTEEDTTDPSSIMDTNGDHEDSDDDFELEQHQRCNVDIAELKKEHLDLRRFGAWCKETIEMELPSYRSAFLYLSTLPLENIHEFLSMKLETKPEKPSLLSIKQLICELRDGLTIAVRVRARFIRHIQTALIEEPEQSPCRIVFNHVLETFEKTLEDVYKLYLEYLTDWAGEEYLPRATLAAEWAFNCYLARSLRPAATLAPLTFCCLTVRQLNGAADRLKTRLSELGKEANRLKLSKPAYNNEEALGSIKWRILTKCRVMQCMLTQERERILSTSQFARTISMHLHYNSVFRDFRQKIYRAMSNVRDVICWLITSTEDTTSPKRLSELEDADKPSVQSRTKEIVSQAYKFGFEFHKEMCRLINDTLSPECLYNACARNSLSQNRRSKLIRSESVNENNHTSIEETIFYLNTPTVSNQEFQFPGNSNPRMTNKKLKEESFSRCLYKSGYKKFQKNFIQGTKFPSFDSIASGISLADLNHEDFKNGIPGCDDCNRIKTKEDESRDEVDSNIDWEENVSRSLVIFSKQWMNFAMQRCERGRGLRPRWASHGLEFLMLTCDPQHTKHLTDTEFEELKQMMDGCISHVIGTAGSAGTSAVGTPTLTMPTPQRTRTSINYPQHPLKSVPSSPPSTQDFQIPVLASDAVRVDKRMVSLCELDHKRDTSLRKAGVIGCVRQGAESRDHFRPRPVTFKWQRGIKIGQGRFGKVYTVVNTETGCLLAMKEVSLALGDRRAVERAANELKILEGVVHPNLVQYYGVEIHREEMLIFMELCVEGSLEALIADTCVEEGSGLPEGLIRKYTRQLVSAVRALHVRAIAHRDIKSGNIFLTEEGNCLKLGDFGCAVKIRANTTVPGELQGYVGTQAYMAPEVFMKSSGHGRAADIWSLGCVVVEMSTGKRPWIEYDSNYQIMFVVGMGGKPEPSPTLSSEGLDFCYSCLQHDPTQRPTIETLSHHQFVKGNTHEDF